MVIERKYIKRALSIIWGLWECTKGLEIGVIQ